MLKKILGITNDKVFYGSLAVFILFAWYCHSYNWDLMQAYTGFSPVTYVMQLAHPDNFARDFPLGVSITDASSFMHIYKYFYGLFGVHPDITGQVLILLEITMMVVGFIVFARIVRPDISRTALFILVLLVVASQARDINLAYFSHPFFEGQYYNAADFARLMAFAAILSRRYLWAGVAIGLCFTVHPILAMMGGVFMGAMVLADPKDLKRYDLWLGGSVAAVIALLWSVFYLGVGRGGAAMPAIPHDEWFLFTQMTSHWYPIEMGGFTTGAPNKIFPFLSFMMLFIYYSRMRSPLSRIDKAVFYGVCAALLMVIIGLFFSEQRSYPVLVKICLLRANDLIVMVGLPYVVMGLLGDITKGKWYAVLPAFGLLIAPFIDPLYAGWHTGLTLVLIVPALIRADKTKWDYVLIALVGSYLVYAGYYASLVSIKHSVLAFYFADNLRGYLLMPILFGAALYLGIARRSISKALISLVCFALALNWLWADRDFTKPAVYELARDYKDVQLWAHDNTAQDALFMVEPSISYGWRAYSERASFGTPREHYLISWIYNGDFEAYQEGQNRLKIYKADILNIVKTEKFPRPIITQQASKEYNNLADYEFYNRIIDTYSVDYFVFEKTKIAQDAVPLIDTSQWMTAFENGSFIVLSKNAPAVN